MKFVSLADGRNLVQDVLNLANMERWHIFIHMMKKASVELVADVMNVAIQANEDMNGQFLLGHYLMKN